MGLSSAIGRMGVVGTAAAAAKIVFDWFRARWYWFVYEVFLVPRRRGWRYECLGTAYPYFYHPYNSTYRGERTVELPIALAYLTRAKGKRVLEVGNVCSHYAACDHLVLDKYERLGGIVNRIEFYDPGRITLINEDAADWTPPHPFDLVLSISTLEHVGWDEPVKEPEKAVKAVERLKSFVAPGGTLLVTWPVGYNPALDDAIGSGRLTFTKQAFLVRLDRQNRWREASWAEVKTLRYGRRFPAANAILVGIDSA